MRNVIALLLLFLSFNNFVVSMQHSGFFSTEAALLTQLLQNYNTQVRPTKNPLVATNVTCDMNLKQIIDLNEKEGELTTSLYMYLSWEDSRLTWNRSDFDDINLIRIPPSSIWTPDVILTNTIDDNMQGSVEVNALVYSTGLIEWLPLSIFKTTCSIKVAQFPFDKQRCDLVFKSAAYDSSQIKLMLDKDGKKEGKVGYDPSEFVPHGEWDLLPSPAVINEPLDIRRDATEAVFTLITKRKPLFYTLNMLLPCMLVNLLSCFTFYLPSSSCEKISLGISLLIGDTIFIFLFANRMPSTSFSVPLIAAYLLFTIALLSACVVTSTFVLSLYWRSNSSHTMPNWYKKFIFFKMNKIAGLKHLNYDESLHTTRMFKKNPFQKKDFLKINCRRLQKNDMQLPEQKVSHCKNVKKTT